MQRPNAGKTDSSDLVETKDTKKNFSDLTFKDMQKEKCVICYEKLETKAIVILPCQHGLDVACFAKLQHYKFVNCPLCKSTYNNVQEENNFQEEDDNCCTMCIIKSKNLMINTIEKTSEELIEESRNCINNPKDYVERHLTVLRSFLGYIWSSYGED